MQPDPRSTSMFDPRVVDEEAFVRAGLLGSSRAVERLLGRVRKLARSTVPVLVRGELGSGKECVARAIHFNSERSAGPLVVEECSLLRGAVGRHLLFGHVRGAFSGATQTVPGLVELADRGTLVLREVGDLDFEAQGYLLRVLDRGEYRPLGTAKVHKTDLRIITTTSRDLRALVEAGTFRRDLYLRIRGAVVDVPPLRERRADIPALIERLLGEEARRSGRRRPLEVNDGAKALLMEHDWPGNVRELKMELFQAAALADERISADQLLFVSEPLPEEQRTTLRRPALRRKLSDIECAAIEEAIQAAGGNKAEAARRLGMTRRTLYRRLEEMKRRRGGVRKVHNAGESGEPGGS